MPGTMLGNRETEKNMLSPLRNITTQGGPLIIKQTVTVKWDQFPGGGSTGPIV